MRNSLTLSLSLLLVLSACDSDDPSTDGGASLDASTTQVDSGTVSDGGASANDAASDSDAGPVVDAGPGDGGASDAGLSDAGLSDAGLSDAGLSDAGLSDAGPATCDDTADCGDTEYCAREGTCGGRGVCTIRPTFCTDDDMPVCGCDLTTYSNACQANVAGTNVGSTGACSSDACRDNADCALNAFCRKEVGMCGSVGVCIVTDGLLCGPLPMSVVATERPTQGVARLPTLESAWSRSVSVRRWSVSAWRLPVAASTMGTAVPSNIVWVRRAKSRGWLALA